MREWRIRDIEDLELRIEELRDRIVDLENMRDEAQSELEDLEYDLEEIQRGLQVDSEIDEWRMDDDRQRAADMNATLRDIGGEL